MAASSYHQEETPEWFENQKWVWPEWNREVIFSWKDWSVVNDLHNRWTYNFFPWALWSTTKHFKYDVWPWRRWWTWFGDTHSMR
jgi:hypothetical protein